MAFPMNLVPNSTKNHKKVSKFHLIQSAAFDAPKFFKFGLFGLFWTKKVTLAHVLVVIAHSDKNLSWNNFSIKFLQNSHCDAVWTTVAYYFGTFLDLKSLLPIYH